MKNAAFLVWVIVLIAPRLADARPVREWSYSKLVAESDIVAIVSVASTRDVENTDRFFESATVQRRARLSIKALVKGERRERTIELVYFRQKTQEEVGKGKVAGIVNGPSYVTLTKREPSNGETPEYLIFVRRRKDGRFEPVSGHLDPQWSVKRLADVK